MDHIDQLAHLEQRAKKLGVSLTAMALNSGVYPHYVARWKKGKTIPRVTTFGNAVQKMSAYLDRLERGATW